MSTTSSASSRSSRWRRGASSPQSSEASGIFAPSSLPAVADVAAPHVAGGAEGPQVFLFVPAAARERADVVNLEFDRRVGGGAFPAGDAAVAVALDHAPTDAERDGAAHSGPGVAFEELLAADF